MAGITSISAGPEGRGIRKVEPRVAAWGSDLCCEVSLWVSVLRGKCQWAKDVSSCAVRPAGDAVWCTRDFSPGLHDLQPDPLDCPERRLLPDAPHFCWRGILIVSLGIRALMCKHRNFEKVSFAPVLSALMHCLPHPSTSFMASVTAYVEQKSLLCSLLIQLLSSPGHKGNAWTNNWAIQYFPTQYSFPEIQFPKETAVFSTRSLSSSS